MQTAQMGGPAWSQAKGPPGLPPAFLSQGMRPPLGGSQIPPPPPSTGYLGGQMGMQPPPPPLGGGNFSMPKAVGLPPQPPPPGVGLLSGFSAPSGGPPPDPQAALEEGKAELEKAELSAKRAAAEGKAFVGIVARLIPSAGVGAIQCAESAQQYGGNVQIPKEQLGNLKISDSVVFKVEANALGIPQVTFARRLDSLSLFRQQLMEVQAPLPAPGTPESSQEYIGFVTSFEPEQGFGMLSCVVTRQQYGQDVYIHRDQFADLNVSDAVNFKVAVNAKGQPVARSVRKATGGSDNSAPPPPPAERSNRSKSRSRSRSRDRSRDRRRRR
eukprot:TRINITY_DN111176_c0_g1_i1.p1 TRINITY_DN111176_c0_g1~~TRINITY_DN111176_c0_g1_i1.p1  ORF type:complete len:327 (-),score=51.34 TRINITY_DN111176_c0_g1_i1:111-1091(-)